MHIFLAHGGLAQYEVNGAVLALTAHGVQLSDLDAWVTAVQKPRGFTRLPKNFFQKRIVARDGAHIRAFASEMLSAISLLGFFMDVVMKNDAPPSLSLVLQCFDLLRIMMTIFQRGDAKHIPTLQTAMQTHHEIYVQLYHAIPKVHMQRHVVDFWLRWGYLLSCFGPERHHKIMKQVMRFTYHGAHKSALAYDVRLWLNTLNLKQLYMPTHLSRSVHAENFEVTCPGGRVLTFTEWSVGLNTEFGELAKGDMLQYTYDSVLSIGLVKGFASTAQPDQIFVAVTVPCRRLTATTWSRPPEPCVNMHFVQSEAIISSVPYFAVGFDEFRPCLHVE